MDRLIKLDDLRAASESRPQAVGNTLGAVLDESTCRHLAHTFSESSGRDTAARAASWFVDLLAGLDRGARRQHRTLPTPAEKLAVSSAFWEGLIPALADVEIALDEPGLLGARREVQTVLNPWLLRSRLWARSWLKPHGYAGDYRMLEWMYDLEHDRCADPYQPAVVNLLDGLYRSVHSVQAVWHRRAWFADVIAGQVGVGGVPLRVLDVACGGSRYVRDVIERCGERSVRPTFFDQDPAALAFVQSRLPKAVRSGAKIVCAPVHRIHQLLPAARPGQPPAFDVVISTGLFDYLAPEPARQLLAHMSSLTRPGGTVAICNFSPADPSRIVKDWVADWRLIYRTRSQLSELFPLGTNPAISDSPDGGLLYAQASGATATDDRHARR